jgi:3'-phosphoadenosine 5'-phosphosulfate sulfotransferase (PAPS reductase)/FAD synthetase
MKQSLEIINNAYTQHPKSVIAFSGGSDSTVLVDLIYTKTKHRPPLVIVDSGMEHPVTVDFATDFAKQYGAELYIAKPTKSYMEQWTTTGWPMLGKLAARLWMQKHRDQNFGYRLDVSSCCRNLKIMPGRKLTRQMGATLQFTGQRGDVDDLLRGMRAIKDTATKYLKTDKITICNPLQGWTDTMITRYIEDNKIPRHPSRAAGAITIGCLYCGGGAQFTNSGFKVLRAVLPDKWREFVVDMQAGEIILSIKHNRPLDHIRAAVKELGGLGALAEYYPWIFDYLAYPPMKGYTK